jgi:tyrosine-protein kinase Etk/Wzc
LTENNDAGSPFNVDAVVKTLKGSWILVVSLALFFGIAAGVYAYFQTSVYSTSATIKLEGMKSRSASDPLTQAISGSQSDLYTEIQILQSRFMASKVLDTVDFSTRYFIKSGWKTRELYKKAPFIVSDSYLDPAIAGRQFELVPTGKNKFRLSIVQEDGFHPVEALRRLILGIKKEKEAIKYSAVHTYGEKISTEWFTLVVDKVFKAKIGEHYFFTINNSKIQLAQMVQSGVRVSSVGRYTSMLRVSFNDTVPLRAKEVVNALCEAYIEEGLKRQTSEAEKSLAFLDEQLGVINKKLERSESSLESFKKVNVMVDMDSKAQATMKTLTTYETQLTQLDLQLNMVSTLEQYLASGKDISNISFDSTQLQAPTLGDMIEKLQEAKAQLSSLLVEYTENHPEVVKVNEQINILKNNIRSTITNIKQNLLAQKKSLEKVVEKYTKSMQSLPQKEQELANLKRSYMVNEQVYSFLLQQRAQTAVLKASTVSNTEIVDAALLPTNAVKPKRKIIVAAGFLFGLLLGLAVAFLRDFLNNTIKSKEDVERLTHIPVFGVVPINKGKKFGSVFQEAFRTIRTNLEFMRIDTNYQTIVVTSTVSGEGKTTVAANLAAILAKGEKKVVVIDLDMRRAKLSEYFGMRGDIGVSTLLSKKNELEEVIQHSGEEGVDLIAAGPVPPNPSELIMSDYAKIIMNTLREQYDYIVLDTPPVGLVTDAAILMHRADVSLLVIRDSYSKKEFVKSLDRFVKDHEIDHVGLILNGVNLEKNYGYGYGYGYKYGGEKYYRD